MIIGIMIQFKSALRSNLANESKKKIKKIMVIF